MKCKKCGKEMELRPNRKVWHCWYCGYEERASYTNQSEEAKFSEVDDLLVA